MVRTLILPVALLAAQALFAQSIFQRALNNDTMPNIVPNPGFEEVKKVPCAWTQQAAKFNTEMIMGWNSPTETTPDTPQNDTPPPEDSPAERFEDFCAQNPGAC